MEENQDFVNTPGLRAAREAFEGTPDGELNRNEDAAEIEHGKRTKTQIDKAQDDSPSIFNSLFRGVGIGGTDAINEIDKTFGLSNTLKNTFGVDVQLGEETFLYDTEKDLDRNPRNTFEALLSTFSQFLLPFGPAVKGVTKVTKGAQLLKNSPKLKLLVDGLIAGAPVDAAAFDPKDPNLGNFLLSFDTIANNPEGSQLIKDFLATDPNDPDALNRAKNAFTGGLAGILTAGLIEGLKGGFGKLKGKPNPLLKPGEKFTNVADDVQLKAKGTPLTEADAAKKGIVQSKKNPLLTEAEQAQVDAAAKESAESIAEAVEAKIKQGNPEEIAELQGKLPNRGTPPISDDVPIDDTFNRLSPEDQTNLKDMLIRAAKGEIDDLDTVVDAAGKKKIRDLPFNLNKLTAGDDILKTIQSVGRIIKGDLPRNVPLSKKIEEFSTIFGVDEATFTKRLKAVTSNVEEASSFIEASKAVSGIQTKKILNLAEAYLENPSAQSEFAFNRAMIEGTETIRSASGLGTAFGQGLNQFKKVADLSSFTQQADILRMELMNRTMSGTDNLAKRKAAMAVRLATKKGKVKLTGTKAKAIKKQAKLERLSDIQKADLEQMQAMSRFIHQGTLARTRDGLLEIYINGLLSRPETQVVNMTGSFSAITASIFERSFAGLKNSSANGVQAGEASQMILSYMDSLFDAWSLFGKAFKEGPQNALVKTDFLRPHSKVLSKEAFGLGPGAMGSAIDMFGKFVNLPGKMLLSADDVMKTMNYRAEIAALSQRKAAQTLGKIPKTPEDFANLIRLREKFHANPTNEMMEQAHEFASVNTFTNKLPSQEVFDVKSGKNIQVRGFARNIQRAIEAFPTSKVFIPFFQTPVQLLTFAFQRTPVLNRFSRVVAQELASPDLAVRQLAQAKTATGIALYTTGIGLGLSGQITGAPPLDPDLRARQQEAGVQPYSINTADGPISYNRFDPLGGTLAVAANMSLLVKSMIDTTGHAEKYGYTREIFEKYQQIFADATIGTARIVADRHYLQGFGMLIDFLSGDPAGFKKGSEALGTFLNPGVSLYSSFRRGIERGVNPERSVDPLSPTVIEQGDELEDIVMKEFGQKMGELADDIARQVPGFGERSVARNVIGEPTYYPGSGQNEDLHLMPVRVLNQLLNPAKGAPKVKSAVLRKIGELDIAFEGADQVEVINGVKLNDEERDFFGTTWGKMNKRLEQWVESKGFNKLSEELQKELLLTRLLANKKIARNRTATKFSRIRGVHIDDIKNSIKRRQQPIAGNDINNLFQINE